jgi:superfamily I DNA/RNA helicase
VATPYRAVVIDEAQDLTQMGLQLAFALAGGGRPDGLFILGDGQQSVYPGGVNLLQAGIDVRGRSTLLRVNYRNPQPIANFARRLADPADLDDLGDEPPIQAEPEVVVREGEAPELEGFESPDAHDAAMLARIEELAGRDDTGAGDIAVLVPTNRLAQHYGSLISEMGLRTQKLAKYEGVPNDAVKVGTYQRGKGLEFKRVFVPRLDSEGIGDTKRQGEDDPTHAERLERLRRQVYVAITRARDGVWLGWAGPPAPLFEQMLLPSEGAQG